MAFLHLLQTISSLAFIKLKVLEKSWTMQIGPTGEFLTPAAVAPSLPPFLRLPREIRDLIYDAVLGATEEAPDFPSACGPRLDFSYRNRGLLERERDWTDPCQ